MRPSLAVSKKTSATQMRPRVKTADEVLVLQRTIWNASRFRLGLAEQLHSEQLGHEFVESRFQQGVVLSGCKIIRQDPRSYIACMIRRRLVVSTILARNSLHYGGGSLRASRHTNWADTIFCETPNCEASYGLFSQHERQAAASLSGREGTVTGLIMVLDR